MATGNGFPAACYTIFKVMWYRNHEPDMFRKVTKILGTKDYINFKLTGAMKTDYSYASGTGIYDLKGWNYHQEFIRASGIPGEFVAGHRSIDSNPWKDPSRKLPILWG